MEDNERESLVKDLKGKIRYISMYNKLYSLRIMCFDADFIDFEKSSMESLLSLKESVDPQYEEVSKIFDDDTSEGDS